jgi:hypothetical protein
MTFTQAQLDLIRQLERHHRELITAMQLYVGKPSQVLAWDNGLCVGIKGSKAYATAPDLAADLQNIPAGAVITNGNGEVAKPRRRFDVLKEEAEKLADLLATFQARHGKED